MKHKDGMKNLTFEDEQLWSEQASQLPWFKKWNKILAWDEPFAQWFVGGKINASYACLDVHIKAGRGGTVAFLWEDEYENRKQITYQELYDAVNKLAFSLQKSGVKKGDVVALYMPMIQEAVVAMLATVRLGALHTVVFSGFGADALRDRIIEADAKIVITANTGVRRGKFLPLKQIVDKAIAGLVSVAKVVVVKRSEQQCTMMQDRDVWWHDFISSENVYVEPEAVDATHPLFILYTSGSTGCPKGIVHATGGYLTYVHATIKWAFDLQKDSIYWCTADIGWITGHSYVVYGPLMHGVTSFIYEGAPDAPTKDVWWKLIERYKITVFYTAPTALRLFMQFGDELVTRHNLKSLKVLGSVGEPINPQVWSWYQNIIGGGVCPIIDTWWQTETGGFMISPTAGLHLVDLRPGSATFPLPGIDAAVVDQDGHEVPAGVKGFLVIRKPWPGMLKGFYKDQEHYKKTYWSRVKGMYFSGDYAMKDADGYFWLLGRADEVLNVAGHRIGTAEVETAALAHPLVVEAAAIGIDDAIKGESVVVFVVLQAQTIEKIEEKIQQEVVACIHQKIGKFVTPNGVYCVKKLPKTRSGKIMRRVLKAMIMGSLLGDLSTIEEEGVVEEIMEIYQNFYAKQPKN